MVHRLGFTYADVKSLTRTERLTFLGFYEEEIKREQEAIRG